MKKAKRISTLLLMLIFAVGLSSCGRTQKGSVDYNAPYFQSTKDYVTITSNKVNRLSKTQKRLFTRIADAAINKMIPDSDTASYDTYRLTITKIRKSTGKYQLSVISKSPETDLKYTTSMNITLDHRDLRKKGFIVNYFSSRLDGSNFTALSPFLGEQKVSSADYLDE